MRIVLFGIFLAAANLMAVGLTFEKTGAKNSSEKVPAPTKEAAKPALKQAPPPATTPPRSNPETEAPKPASVDDLKNISARLRVEGASFRNFRLYLAPTKIMVGANHIQNKFASEIRQIIDRDLSIVSGFSFIVHSEGKADDDALMQQKGAEGISRLALTFKGDTINAAIEHRNLMSGKRSFKTFSANPSGIRRLSHQIAQNIYEEFIGPENIFMLRIAAVKRDATSSQVVMLDFDGSNETVLTEGAWDKTGPSFSPDGKSILYTVISPQGQGIVEQAVPGRHYQFRVRQRGLNLDPRILPDNSGMLVTLSHEKQANIYRVSRTGTLLGKVTEGLGLNLSPSISPDGKELAFVSDRAGSPQIYVQSLTNDGKSKQASRLTFQGKYNQTPHFSPDGKLIAFTGRDENKVFDIFLIERTSGRVSRITENQGRNQEPHFTPSGRFVIFTSEREGSRRPDIFLASLNGDHQVRLTNANMNKNSNGYFSPVVSPK